MSTQKLFKSFHVCGTLWFLLCAAALLTVSLRQAGFQWWFIFSISGYSAMLLFLGFTVYLFAVYQGVVRNQNAIEHPLTVSPSYIILYDIAPFLGSISGLLASTDWSLEALLNATAQGTLAMTFVMWILIDPIVGIVESTLPQSIAFRKERISKQRTSKIRLRHENEQLLRRLEQQETVLKAQWNAFLGPFAKEAANLVCDPDPSDMTQRRLIELGALAWQQGQLICMQYFHEMILREIRGMPNRPTVDYTALWWDGIGLWRRPEISALILEPKTHQTMLA